MTRIDEPAGGDLRSRSIDVTADGAGSRVDLSALATYTDRSAGQTSGDGLYSTVTATRQGEVLVPQLATAAGVRFVTDGSSLLDVSGLTTLTDGRADLSNAAYDWTGLTAAPGTHFVVEAGHADLSNLTDLTRGRIELNDHGTVDVSALSHIDGASFDVRDGVTLTISAATGYAHASTANDQTRTFRAEGDGSVLDLPNLDEPHQRHASQCGHPDRGPAGRHGAIRCADPDS